MSTTTQPAILQKGYIRAALATAAILSVPLIATLVTEEVQWGLEDFIMMGALIFATGLVYEYVVKRISNPRQRLVAAIALFLTLFLIWVELAVGIFD